MLYIERSLVTYTAAATDSNLQSVCLWLAVVLEIERFVGGLDISLCVCVCACVCVCVCACVWRACARVCVCVCVGECGWGGEEIV